MFCSHCGTKIDGGHVFCPNCGEKLPLQSEEKKKPFWLKALFALPFIALLFLVGYLFTENPAVSTVEDQLDALHQHKLTEAYYEYTTASFQEATPLDKFKEKIKSLPALTSVKKVDVVDEKDADDVSTLNVVVTTDTGDTFNMEYQLTLVDGVWKILYFKFIDNKNPSKI